MFDVQVNWIESATIDNVLCRSTKTHSCVIELDRCFSDHHLYYSIDDLVDKVSEAIQAMYGMTVSLRQNERTFHTYETALHTMLQLSPTVMTGRNAIIAILIRTFRLFIKKHDPPIIDRSKISSTFVKKMEPTGSPENRSKIEAQCLIVQR